jgi:hypothetical protein
VAAALGVSFGSRLDTLAELAIELVRLPVAGIGASVGTAPVAAAGVGGGQVGCLVGRTVAAATLTVAAACGSAVIVGLVTASAVTVSVTSPALSRTAV